VFLLPQAALLLAGGGCASTSTPTPGDPAEVTSSALSGSGLNATLALSSDWGAGYCANVTVMNTGAPITSWQAVIALNGSTYASGWSATLTPANGQLTAAPLSWNAALATGSSTTFGFCGNSSTSTARPTLLSISGSGSGSGGGAAGSAGSSGAGGAAGSAGASGSAGKSGGGGSAGTTGGAGSAGMTSGGTGGTGGTGGSKSCGGGTAVSGDVSVTLSSLQQHISGFGASTAWGSTMSAADAATLWSTTSGAGLSLHRVRIDPTTGQTSETNIAKLAVGYGVKVWATPWTPPPADKSNNSTVEGTLTNGAAYAKFLTGFVNYMKGQGVNIFAVSAGNEPDANVTYESCVYTGATMDSFITNSMGPAFAGTGVKILAPETQNWCGFPNFEPTLVKNSNISIIATHEYGCSPKAYPDIAAAGKEFWETEIYDTANNTADPGMGSALRVAKLIHDAMTISNMNAWHYWWVFPASTDNGALWDKSSGQATKRLWVEGNYARFVRPGFTRVGTGGSVPSGVLLSAYTNPADGTVAVVAINNNASSTPVSVFVSGAAPCAMTPYVTDATRSLGVQAVVSVSGSRFSFTLPAQSVTTFVGK
jgi:glucuronoarabinoxylan endo-1,4-beta-xylanase